MKERKETVAREVGRDLEAVANEGYGKEKCGWGLRGRSQ